jgi:hypothetical protein
MSKLSRIHPFAEIPDPGDPVISMALADSVRPLVAGAYSLTMALGEVSREGLLTAEEMHDGLVLLTGVLGLAGEVLDRWNSDEDAARPPEKGKKP